MNMQRLTDFLKNEGGAVTVDWVVLTASVVILGLVIVGLLRESILNMVTYTADNVLAAETYFEP
jgi:hypothetical protein